MSLNLFEALSKPKTIIGGRASVKKERTVQPINVVEPPRYSGRDYAREYVKKEEETYERISQMKQSENEDRRETGGMSDVDTMTNRVSDFTNDDDQRKQTYNEFNFDTRTTSIALPILEKKAEILKKLSTFRVIIIKGATGCGKTTQVPQFILDQCREINQNCDIIVTQPRRIAAISVAKRVCMERDWKMGSVVGYQIGQHREVSDSTMITFCTTGVLLQKIVKEKRIPANITHIILDEVHERDAEMDFLLILVRKYANTTSRNVKVILMSATINTDMFSEYFHVKYPDETKNAPVIAASDKLTHHVRIFYLHDLHEIPESGSMIPENDSPDITKKGYTLAVKIIKAIDALERHTAEKKKTKVGPGAVLVFLPGLFEIEEMKKQLEEYSSDIYGWWIVPLHSSITTEEQDKVFHNPPEKCRKIVLSTNIAESSITVPDIKYVIDFGLTKVLVTDPDTNLASLQLSWTSKNSMIQRAGRAGRVSEGRVYRLLEKSFYDNMEEETTPEMLRCPLDQLVLKTKLLDSGPPQAIFALAMNQPDLRNIEQTVLSLKEIGALTLTVVSPQTNSNQVPGMKPPKQKYEINDLDGDLTELGSTIAKLPMDVRLGKLIFFGDLFNVLDECIVMACAMSVKNMFSSPFQAYLKAYNSKLAWANSSCSDCIAYLHAYTVWRKKKSENAFRAKNSEVEWCRTRFLQLKILKEIAHLHNDVKIRLRGMFEENIKRPKLNYFEKNLFIKLSLAAAFYPNYFLRGSHSGKVDEQQAVATLSGHDPYSTVYLQGMPNNQHGILYKKTIEKYFEEVSSRVNVHFDHGSKVLINFGHYANESAPGSDRQNMLIPGKIDLAVYRAVKMRQLKSEIRIPVFNAAEADKRVQSYLQRYDKIESKPSFEVKLLQWPWDKTLDTHGLPLIELRITNIESPTRFWARSPTQMITQQFQEICEFLNGPGGVVSIEEDENIKIGNIYAYKVNMDGRSEYVRCRIESYKHFNDSYGISFIDIGEGKTGVKRKDIRAINDLKQNHYDTIPDLATEFSLVKVQPSSKYEGKWAPKTIQFLEKFKKLTDHRKVLIGKIYSMVNNVAKVKLYHCYINNINQQDSLKNTVSINEQLINNDWAEKTEEPFLSKQDHEERKKLTELFEEGGGSFTSGKNLTEKEILIQKLNSLDLDEPTRAECRHEVILKGPFSPLEMRIFSATRCSMPKLAIIERNSVNSVLLDTNPADEHERMVVSSFVGISPSRDKLFLRDTTIMPSLPGFPALICLFFSPMIEMRCDPDFTRFTGALCGLGYEKESKRPLNGDKDMEITFDVEISLDMLVKINRVRFWLSRFLASEKYQPAMNATEKETGYGKLRDYVNELVWHKWVSEEMFYTTEAHKWSKISPDRLLNPCSEELPDIEEPAEDVTSVYRLIWGIDLDGDKEIRLEVIRKNLRLLKEFSAGQLFIKEVECKLCQITLPNRTNARLHMKSALHKARAIKYLEPNDKNYDSRSETTEGYEDY